MSVTKRGLHIRDYRGYHLYYSTSLSQFHAYKRDLKADEDQEPLSAETEKKLEEFEERMEG